ncbi:MAG: hypothetical protein ABSF45_01905 [Terriglobia bacterium]|jgi:hypothetical protein
MIQTTEQKEVEIREAAGKKNIDLTQPENAYVVCKNAPGGWNFYPHSDLDSAARDAVNHVSQGNIDVYILDSGGVQFSLIALALLR